MGGGHGYAAMTCMWNFMSELPWRACETQSLLSPSATRSGDRIRVSGLRDKHFHPLSGLTSPEETVS